MNQSLPKKKGKEMAQDTVKAKKWKKKEGLKLYNPDGSEYLPNGEA